MKTFLLKVITLLALLNTLAAYADSGAVYNLRVTGTIISESCEVDTSSQEQSVSLGEFDSSDFPSTGATSAWVPFNIQLKNCSKAINGTKIWFSGLADTDNPALLALSDTGKGTGSTMATGLGVEISDADQSIVPINNTESATFTLRTGDNELTFNLRYKSTRQDMTPGDATAVMYFDLLYQ
ncbi:TPA: fimbrial protein [Enterobacter chengduensis]|uniref:Fimbrial protein n=1 Tax=Enterobacter chengduensis TaxID=2494701 RepID=A0AAW3HGN3_9ENTR|nr:fimbrial protein [Enterobacter chengduensis]KDF46777.1 hypothetical protein AE07_02632 [Enterobacter cloacae BWH 43]OTW34428.1 fimbrial protein [Enterobacter kobei]GJL42585.1 fimbrial protein BcfE [Enterobacter asburiae]KJX35538.1 fimbrial protein [Enterobacter chengduensis]MBN9878508.1 fimbrial protein [Enterobacter chengduensis]